MKMDEKEENIKLKASQPKEGQPAFIVRSTQVGSVRIRSVSLEDVCSTKFTEVAFFPKRLRARSQLYGSRCLQVKYTLLAKIGAYSAENGPNVCQVGRN